MQGRGYQSPEPPSQSRERLDLESIGSSLSDQEDLRLRTLNRDLDLRLRTWTWA